MAIRALLIGASVLIVIVAAAGLGEVTIRWAESRRDSVPGTLPLIYYRHVRLGRALIRNGQYFEWVSVNSHGFRGREMTVKKDPETVRIMAVGGSTTFDVCAGDDNQTWPARLAYWLNEPPGSRRFEVINAGVPGYLLIDQIIRLQTELHVYDPDVIILYAGHNDLSHSLHVGSIGGVPPSDTPNEAAVVTPWGRWLTGNSLLYNKVSLRVKALARQRRNLESSSGSLTPAKWNEALDSATAFFRRDLLSFVLIANAMGIRVILPEVVHVSGMAVTEVDLDVSRSWRGTFSSPPDVTLEGYRRLNQVHRNVAQSTGADFISTGAFGIRGKEFFCRGRDPIHFSPSGSEEFSRELAKALLRLGFGDSHGSGVPAQFPGSDLGLAGRTYDGLARLPEAVSREQVARGL